MTWRDGAIDAQDNFMVSSRSLDKLVDASRGRIMGFATPAVYIDRYRAWHESLSFAMTVTEQEVVLAKIGLLGVRVKLREQISRFDRYGTGLHGGHGPLYEYSATLSDGGRLALLFKTPEAMESVAELINGAVGAAKDPDLADLHRALAAARELPDGDLGRTLSPAELIAESVEARRQLAAGDYEDLWRRRVALGYGVSDEGVPQADRFWLDAAPAIAALRAGHKSHPMVAMCCGMAEQNHDRENADQVEAVATFNELYHG